MECCLSWDGWNFISSPIYGETVTGGDNCVASFWNGKINTEAIALKASDFRPCKAFWVYSEVVRQLLVDGRMGVDKPVLRPGWNPVGSLYYQKTSGSCFSMEGQSYVLSADGMLPGVGYWILYK